jgi:hypothetical protein
MEADAVEAVVDDGTADKGTMLIVMTAVDPNDLQQPPPQQPPTSGTILLPAADEFLISSAQINEERQVFVTLILDMPVLQRVAHAQKRVRMCN